MTNTLTAQERLKEIEEIITWQIPKCMGCDEPYPEHCFDHAKIIAEKKGILLGLETSEKQMKGVLDSRDKALQEAEKEIDNRIAQYQRLDAKNITQKEIKQKAINELNYIKEILRRHFGNGK